MLIPPVQLPPISASVSQPQTVVNTLPQVLTQAVAPIGQQAVAPTPKSERGQKAKERRQRARDEGGTGKETDGRGGHLNISV